MANFELLDFSEKAKRARTFSNNFLKCSAKGSLRYNKIKYEILQLSADSRYLQSVALA